MSGDESNIAQWIESRLTNPDLSIPVRTHSFVACLTGNLEYRHRLRQMGGDWDVIFVSDGFFKGVPPGCNIGQAETIYSVTDARKIIENLAEFAGLTSADLEYLLLCIDQYALCAVTGVAHA